jgi:hypothetical protein
MSFETCSHVKEDGVYCSSPALRGRKYCYYHLMQRGRRLRLALAQGRSEPAQLILPPLENLSSMSVALSEIVQALAAGQLDHRSAGLMLYAIQQAATVSLRLAQMEVALQGAQGEGAKVEAAVAKDGVPQVRARLLGANLGPQPDNSHRLQEYPEFERKFGLQPGVDLDAETDHAMRAAEDQAAVYAVAPTYQPGTGCPVPSKIHYTREEAYQSLQWQIHQMKQQIRAYKEERKLELSKKQATSETGPPNSASNTA